MIIRRAFVGLAAILCFNTCGTVKPIPVNVGDTCYGCRCQIVEPRLAGEMIDRSGHAYKFGTPACMARYVTAHRVESATLFVTDFATGDMIQVGRASFVPVIVDTNKMKRDYRAYLRRLDAEAFAHRENAAVLDWAAVLTRVRG
jgi:hypothetical protein